MAQWRKASVLPIVIACAACGSSDDGASGNGSSDGGDASAAEDSGPTHDAGGGADGSTANDAASGDAHDASDALAPIVARGCPAGSTGCYTVYAHTAHALYVVGLGTATLDLVGPFTAPIPDGGTTEDVISDLAVTPDDKLWVISTTSLYRADPMTGNVTRVGDLAPCGQGNVALTSDLAGKLYLGDAKGAICSLDPTTTPPTVGAMEPMGNGYALTGDLVVVSDGTTYATAYNAATPATITSNVLLTLDLTNPAAPHAVGATGYPKLVGVAFGLGKVLAFTRDASGDVISVDPSTGQGTLFGTFRDSVTQQPLQFEGAGVNPRVSKSGH